MPAVVAVTIPLNLLTIRLPSPNPDKVDLLKVPRHLWPHDQRIGLLYHLTQRLICDVFTYWDDVIMLKKSFHASYCKCNIQFTIKSILVSSEQ